MTQTSFTLIFFSDGCFFLIRYLRFRFELLQAHRTHGYVRLFLYPRVQFFVPEEIFAIFISKRYEYIVGVQDVDGRVYEVGTKEDGERYFFWL